MYWYKLKEILGVSFHKLEKKFEKIENNIRNNRRSLLMLRRNINLTQCLIKLFITLTKMNAYSDKIQGSCSQDL